MRTRRGRGSSRGLEAASSVVARVMSGLRVSGRLEEEHVRDVWAECVGEDVAAHTRPGRLRRGRLFVTVDSGVWAHRLVAAEAAGMRRAVNAALGKDVVQRMYFRVGALANSKQKERGNAGTQV